MSNYPCSCKNMHGLFVPSRHLSLIIAGLLFLFFGIFVGGYFLGKKHCTQELAQKIIDDSFADKVYSTALSMGEEINNKGDVSFIDTSINTSEQLSINSDISIAQQKESSSESYEEKLYYAQLIGFATENAAQKFATKLSTKNVATEIKKRMGRSTKGKISYWYQVVTQAYNDKHELSKIVDKIAKEERLNDVHICTY